MRRSACSNGSAAFMPGAVVPRQLFAAFTLAVTGTCVLTAPATSVGRFSAMSTSGGFDDGWAVTALQNESPTRFDLVDDNGHTVVKATAENTAASLTRAFRHDAAGQPWINWRWRIDRVVEKSDITTKQGDDFAARLYVFFDYPLDRLSLMERTKLRLARWWYGHHVPAAALCYVWANREQPGTTTWNAYTSRARMIVLRNADSDVGNWVDEKRNLAADFRAAFGDVDPVVTGVAIAADTDQTGESVTAWFGDIRFGL